MISCIKSSLLSAAGLFLMSALSFSQEPIRVACVGDSITYGDKIMFRAFRSYPAILQKISDGQFMVGNFGVNGATALGLQGRAWTQTKACQKALEFDSDIIVIMLGINDLFAPEYHDRYAEALRKIVMRFQSLPSSPRIFLCTLTPLAPIESQQPLNQVIRTVLNPAIRAVATETGAQIIDIHAVFPASLEFLPDGVHPSPEGANLIARTVLKAMNTPLSSPPRIHPAPETGPVDISIRNEALAAQYRAQQWLKTQPPPVELRNPASAWENRNPETPDELADWLPLLEGNPIPNSINPYFSTAALAIALDRIGQKSVFLSTTRSIAWREALLHQLVQSQRIHATGGGYWTNPDAEDSAADAVRSTTYALQAIAIALSE